MKGWTWDVIGWDCGNREFGKDVDVVGDCVNWVYTCEEMQGGFVGEGLGTNIHSVQYNSSL